MKKINPYLVAFFAILIHSLVFTMIWPEVVALIALLAKLSFDSYLEIVNTKENTEPLKTELKRLNDKLTQVDNLAKSLNFRK